MSRTLDAISKKSQKEARENEVARLLVPSRFCTDDALLYAIHPVAGGSVLVYNPGIGVGEPTTTGREELACELRLAF